MGKKWTAAQKKAASERAKLAWKARNIVEEIDPAPPSSPSLPEAPVSEPGSWPVERPVDPPFAEPAPAIPTPLESRYENPNPSDPTPPEPVPSQPDYATLQRQVQEMQATIQKLVNTPAPASIGVQGPVGTVTKFSIDAKSYPDPRERLSKESKLAQFAFPVNYEMSFTVSSTRYQTIDKIWMQEPRFVLELIRIMIDEDTGLPTNKRYVVCTGIFFEDPDAALAVAREQGYEIPEYVQKDFLDEMRYLRFRDWLLEAFYMPRASQPRSAKKEMVIGNKLVEVYEANINSDEAVNIPFKDFTKKG